MNNGGSFSKPSVDVILFRDLQTIHLILGQGVNTELNDVNDLLIPVAIRIAGFAQIFRTDFFVTFLVPKFSL